MFSHKLGLVDNIPSWLGAVVFAPSREQAKHYTVCNCEITGSMRWGELALFDDKMSMLALANFA